MYNNRRTKLPFILVLSSNCFCYNVLCVAMVVVLNVYILIFVLFGLTEDINGQMIVNILIKLLLCLAAVLSFVTFVLKKWNSG